MGEALAHWDVVSEQAEAARFYPGRPRRHPDPGRLQPDSRWPDLDLDRERGCIRDIEHAYSKTAASRCSTATSPRTAASSRPPASMSIDPDLHRPGAHLREPGGAVTAS
jgi:hypothetical protein